MQSLRPWLQPPRQRKKSQKCWKDSAVWVPGLGSELALALQGDRGDTVLFAPLSGITAPHPRLPSEEPHAVERTWGRKIRRHLAPESDVEGMAHSGMELGSGWDAPLWDRCQTRVAGTLRCVVRNGTRPLPLPQACPQLKAQSLMRPAPWLGEPRGASVRKGHFGGLRKKPGFTGGRAADCAKAQRCGKAEFGV